MKTLLSILISMQLILPEVGLASTEFAQDIGAAASESVVNPNNLLNVRPSSVAPATYAIPSLNKLQERNSDQGSYCRQDLKKTLGKAGNGSTNLLPVETILQKAADAKINPAHIKKTLSVLIKNQAMVANQRYISIGDYSRNSNGKRFFVIDLVTGNIDSYMMASGKNSDKNHDGKVDKNGFSNEARNKASTKGCNLTGSIYQGGHGASLNLHGLEKTNDNNCGRRVVMHSNDRYMYNDPLGRSWGCQVFREKDRKEFMSKIAGGSISCNFDDSDGTMPQLKDDKHTGKVKKKSTKKKKNSGSYSGKKSRRKSYDGNSSRKKRRYSSYDYYGDRGYYRYY